MPAAPRVRHPGTNSDPSFEPYMEFFAADISFGAAARRLASAAQQVNTSPQWIASLARHLNVKTRDLCDGHSQEQLPIASGSGGKPRPLRSGCPSPALRSLASELTENGAEELETEEGTDEEMQAEAPDARRRRQEANIEFWKQNQQHPGSFEVLIPMRSTPSGYSSSPPIASTTSTASAVEDVLMTPAQGSSSTATRTNTPRDRSPSSSMDVSARLVSASPSGTPGDRSQSTPIHPEPQTCEMCHNILSGQSRFDYSTKTRRVCERCYRTEYYAAKKKKKQHSTRA